MIIGAALASPPFFFVIKHIVNSWPEHLFPFEYLIEVCGAGFLIFIGGCAGILSGDKLWKKCCNQPTSSENPNVDSIESPQVDVRPTVTASKKLEEKASLVETTGKGSDYGSTGTNWKLTLGYATTQPKQTDIQRRIMDEDNLDGEQINITL